jgi:hypothetical protein
MSPFTQEQINNYIELAALKTATELALEDGEDFNPADIGNYDEVYDRGLLDAQIENARFILNLFKNNL